MVPDSVVFRARAAGDTIVQVEVQSHQVVVSGQSVARDQTQDVQRQVDRLLGQMAETYFGQNSVVRARIFTLRQVTDVYVTANGERFPTEKGFVQYEPELPNGTPQLIFTPTVSNARAQPSYQPSPDHQPRYEDIYVGADPEPQPEFQSSVKKPRTATKSAPKKYRYQASEQRDRTQKRRVGTKVTVGALAVLVLAGAGIGGFAIISNLGNQPADVSKGSRATHVQHVPGYQSRPEKLPTKTAPLGYGDSAEWSTSLYQNTFPSVTTDGEAAVLTTTDRVALVGPKGDAWIGDNFKTAVKTVKFTRVAGIPAAAAASSDQLSWVTATTHEKHSVSLPTGSTVYWVGATPLVALANGQAGYIAKSGQLIAVTVPQGYTATAADETGVLVVSGEGSAMRVSEQGSSNPVVLARPNAVTDTAPAIIRTANSRYVVCGWSTGDFTLNDVNQNGKVVASAAGGDPAQLSTATVVFSADGTSMAFGQLQVTWQGKPTITRREHFTAYQFAGDRLYGKTQDQQWGSVTGHDTNISVEPKQDTVAIPWGITSKSAYVLDVHSGIWTLYVLPQNHQ